MSTHSIIGITYTIIGAVHLIVYAAKKIKRQEFWNGDPGEVMVAVFAWPLVDILWIRARRREKRSLN